MIDSEIIVKRALAVIVPLILSFGASAGIVKTVDWLTERPKVDLSAQAEDPVDEKEAGSASRAPASLPPSLAKTQRGYESPSPNRNDERSPASQSTDLPNVTITEEKVANPHSYNPYRAPSSSPDGAAARPEAEKSASSSPSGYGGGSGLTITDVASASGAASGGSGTSSAPGSSSLVAAAAAGSSAGGFALQTTASGHKVNATFGTSLNFVYGTSPSGHAMRMNTPGVTAD